MSPENGLQSVVSDARWLPAHWDRPAAALQFIHLPRERHGEFTFLADEYLGAAQLPTATVSLAELLSTSPQQPPAAHFIFHSAFCCSTLLARALDLPGKAMALKEPQILNELADGARNKMLNGELLALVLRLLSRRSAPDERVIVKPSNVVNLLAPALMDLSDDSRALFLYAPLRHFLGSIARKGLWGRRWGRRLYLQLLRDTGLQFGLGDGEQFELSDLQVAALAWLMHHAQAAALFEQCPGRVRTLDSDTFLARRTETLVSLGCFFEVGLKPGDVDSIVHGSVFKTHSKELGRDFHSKESSGVRETNPVIDDEIEMVATWTNHVADHVGVPLQFSADSALLAAT